MDATSSAAAGITLEPALSLADWRDAERVFRARRESLVEVRESFVLVSQLQRSGGTLLNSLFDGHRELHVHPHEVQVGAPTKHDWPVLNPSESAHAWLGTLREPRLPRLFSGGYWKPGDRAAAMENFPALPFLLVPSFIEKLFFVLCAEKGIKTPRDILDRYFTAFFNAWLDNTGLYEAPKRWISGFGPRLSWKPSRDRFFDDYPSGRLACVLRDPRGWYASASQFSAQYADLENGLALWERNAHEIENARRERPDAVRVVTYEALTRDTETVMRGLADWLGIAWDPLLLRPTFNRVFQLRPNSSHGAMEPVVHADSVERWRETLSPALAGEIHERCQPLYERVRASADFS